MSLERISKNPEDQSAIVHGAGARKICAMATHTSLNSVSSTNSATSASAAAKAYHRATVNVTAAQTGTAAMLGSNCPAATQRSGRAAVCAQPNHNVTLQHFPNAIRESDAHVCNTRRLLATKLLQVGAVVVPTTNPAYPTCEM